jgi:hypothetical protein
LDPIERANLNSWISVPEVVLSKESNRVDVSLPSPEGKKIQFPKHCVFYLFRIPHDEQNPETELFLICNCVLVPIITAEY